MTIPILPCEIKTPSSLVGGAQARVGTIHQNGAAPTEVKAPIGRISHALHHLKFHGQKHQICLLH